MGREGHAPFYFILFIINAAGDASYYARQPLHKGMLLLGYCTSSGLAKK